MTTSIDSHLEILGKLVSDQITKFTGVAASISFDLYGSIQVTVAPTKLDKDGDITSSHWFDISRLTIMKKKNIMDCPNFFDSSVVEKHLNMLGMPVGDKVTEFSGIVANISFDLYGCIQALISPRKLDTNGEMVEGCWFDVNRLAVEDIEPVMKRPNFIIPSVIAEGKKGPAFKPSHKPTLKA